MNKLDDNALTVIATLSGLSKEDCQEAFELFLSTRSKGKTIIPGVELRKIMGWSRSTMKRRYQKYGLKEVTIPGWANRKGVYKAELESKLNIEIPYSDNQIIAIS